MAEARARDGRQAPAVQAVRRAAAVGAAVARRWGARVAAPAALVARPEVRAEARGARAGAARVRAARVGAPAERRAAQVALPAVPTRVAMRPPARVGAQML